MLLGVLAGRFRRGSRFFGMTSRTFGEGPWEVMTPRGSCHGGERAPLSGGVRPQARVVKLKRHLLPCAVIPVPTLLGLRDYMASSS